MKRFIAILAITLFTLPNAEAQLFKVFGHDVGFIYVGPKVGINFSRFTEFNDFYEDFKLGLDLGAVGEFGFTNRFSVQTEMMFFSKGSRDADIGKIKMKYIGIPILAKYSFKLLGLKNVYAMGGTYANVRVFGEWQDATGQTSPLGPDMKKYEWGLGFGFGAEYPMKTAILGADVRYYLGITDIHANDNIKTRTSSISLAVTYKFDMVDIYFKYLKKNKPEEGGDREVGNKGPKGLKVEQRN